MVPREWIQPPEYETANGELLDEEEDAADESSRMLSQPVSHLLSEERKDDEEWNSEEERRRGGSGKGKRVLRDSSGRNIPPAERAPQ